MSDLCKVFSEEENQKLIFSGRFVRAWHPNRPCHLFLRLSSRGPFRTPARAKVANPNDANSWEVA